MNRLAQEKNPYLSQHAGNPVDWFPWGDEAFAKARKENKPVFLSIGYATCHWCHVMERESFADPKTAEIMNRYFVSVKVDREERPDVDKIYMTAATGVGWGGGWPLSIWMTPEGKPFFGGTYFPPESRWGQPGFAPLMERIGKMWAERGADMSRDAEKVADALRASVPVAGREAKPDPAWLDKAADALAAAYDDKQGGFGGAPKFPMPDYSAFLLRRWARAGDGRALEMTVKTLERMAAGGIYDHVGGGFHRYSTDARWHVPHFEKMLYDNAQLAGVYAEAYQATHNPELGRVARETLDYVLRDMTHPEGGFYSAEDADSVPPEKAGEKGHAHKSEGAFYLWTPEELEKALGKPDAELFARYFGVKTGGNVDFDPHGEFAGKNVLYAAAVAAGEDRRRIEAAKKKLLAARARRPRPFLDDKILASWNGLMISGLAKGARALEEPRYAQAAAKAARFLRAKLYDEKSKRLHHRWLGGQRSPEGIADDYAFLLGGLLDLYEADHDPAWIEWAGDLADSMLALFYDRGKGGFYMTAEGAGPELLYRVMEDSDGVEPSASSAAALALLRLAQLTDRTDLRDAAEKTMERFGAQLRDQPRSLMRMLQALDWGTQKPRQVVIAGNPEDPAALEMLRAVNGRFLPTQALIVLRDESDRARLSRRLGALRGMVPLKGKPAAYVCRNFACEMPVTDLAALQRSLQDAPTK